MIDLTNKEFRVMRLFGENVMRLKVVDITPDSNKVIIAGENGQGKSTVLNLISMALGGKNNISDQPIRSGEETGNIVVELGDGKKVELIVSRRFTAKDTYMKITTPDGAQYPKPQKLLGDIFNAITLDPFAFTRMKDEDQYLALKSLVKLDIDIDDIDAKNRTDYAARTDVNREVDRLKASIDGIQIPEGTPEKPVDVVALSDQINDIKERQRNIEQLNERMENGFNQIKAVEDQILDLQNTLVDYRARVKTYEESRDSIIVPTEDEIAELTQSLANATTTNEWVTKAKELAAKNVDLTAKKAASDRLTKTMEDREKIKMDAIAAAKMPIEGLSLQDGKVLYDAGQGAVPFSQASKAQKIRVSTAIAMAMNPNLKVIRIEDASLLDKTSEAIITEMAKTHGFQVWMEVIESNDPAAIYIEDGEIRGAETKAEAA